MQLPAILSPWRRPAAFTLSYWYDGSLLTNAAWSGTVSGTVGFGYDNDFRLKRISVNGVNMANYAFDSDGLLTVAGSMNLRRNAQTGFLTNTVLGSVSDRRAFSGFGEMTNYAASYAGSALFSEVYGFDRLGRITNKTETVQGATITYGYSYNSMGRLVQVSTNGAVHSRYLYDPNGNRTTSVFSASSASPELVERAVNASYDAQDRLLQNGNKSYTWDANGSLLSVSSVLSVVNFSYDSFGNLLSASLPDGRNIEYMIDGANRRVSKKINGSLVQGFLYKDGLKPVAELDGSGNVVSYFIYGTLADIPDYMVKAGVMYRIVADHLGSPRLIVNASTGAITQRMDFDEWGNVTLDTNPGFQPFGFAGGLYDADTRLIRFGARDYDPETGRWTAKDPILFAGGDINLYIYCANNPVNFVDPYGLCNTNNVPPLTFTWSTNDLSLTNFYGNQTSSWPTVYIPGSNGLPLDWQIEHFDPHVGRGSMFGNTPVRPMVKSPVTAPGDWTNGNSLPVGGGASTNPGGFWLPYDFQQQLYQTPSFQNLLPGRTNQ